MGVTNNENQASCDSKDEYFGVIKKAGTVNRWDDDTWAAFEILCDMKLYGEEFMKHLGLTRRNLLDTIFYQFSLRKNLLHRPRWKTDYENGEHALPDLKVGKEGVRISKTRLTRYGIDVTQNMQVDIEILSNNSLKLVFVK